MTLAGGVRKVKGINTGEVPLLEDFKSVYTRNHAHLCAHVCTLTLLINIYTRSLAHILLLPQAHTYIFVYSTVHGKANYHENFRSTTMTYSSVHLFNYFMFVLNSDSYPLIVRSNSISKRKVNTGKYTSA